MGQNDLQDEYDQDTNQADSNRMSDSQKAHRACCVFVRDIFKISCELVWDICTWF